MPTINQELHDSVLRHAIAVRRFSTGEIADMIALLSAADAEIIAMLRGSKAKPDLGSLRFQALVKSLHARRGELMRELRRRLRSDMMEFSALEYAAELDIIEGVIPFEVHFNRIPLEQVRAAAITKPFQGHTLGQWFDGLAAADRRGLTGAIQMGVVQGESIDDIARRVAGTRAMGYRDGVMAITRRNATMVVRTAVNHFSNTAREMVHEANSDVIELLKWVSTLDGRTTPICMSRDGKIILLREGATVPDGFTLLDPQGARPPAHVGCRSLTIPVISVDGLAVLLGDRAFVTDTRTRRQREIDFRARAKERIGKDGWKKHDAAGRRGLIRDERIAWTRANVGHVPAETVFQKWMETQPEGFQIEVLGKTKAALFRRGGLTVDEFVDRRGTELRLSELAGRHPDAFIQAGLDPATF